MSRSIPALLVALVVSCPIVHSAESSSALSNEAIPLQIDAVGLRTRPILELGDTFLGRGNIDSGIRLPTGAVWQPNLMVWGLLRSAVSALDDEQFTGQDEYSEWANRLDLFGQVSLSQTDRIVVGVRPLDEDGDFWGYRFQPDSGSVSGGNAEVSIAFFESNLAELFPEDRDGTGRGWDLDLSVGRMPWLFQEGTLINDRIDSIALARNNLQFVPGSNNTRVALIYGWDDVHRADNREDDDARLVGLFAETDFPRSTVNLDIVRVRSEDTGDGWYAGISAIQRIGKINTAFRVVHSESSGGETPQNRSGTVAVAELSWTPAYTFNNVYANFFWAVDEFTSASRGPATGGPLGLVGILYAATGMGRYPAPLGNDAVRSMGGALGYQMFFQGARRQLILEAGLRSDTDGTDRRQAAIGARFQQALGKRFVVRLDAYVADRERLDTGYGGRVELLVKF